MSSVVQELPSPVLLSAPLQAPALGVIPRAPQEAPVRSAELAALVEASVARLLASSDPAQPPQVRLELKGEAYGGTWISLREVAGRVQVEIVCASEAARQQLSTIVLREADAMARRCRRDLQFRVAASAQEEHETDRPAPAVVEVAGRA